VESAAKASVLIKLNLQHRKFYIRVLNRLRDVRGFGTVRSGCSCVNMANACAVCVSGRFILNWREREEKVHTITQNLMVEITCDL
jgi:hypothetical protein